MGRFLPRKSGVVFRLFCFTAFGCSCGGIGVGGGSVMVVVVVVVGGGGVVGGCRRVAAVAAGTIGGSLVRCGRGRGRGRRRGRRRGRDSSSRGSGVIIGGTN